MKNHTIDVGGDKLVAVADRSFAAFLRTAAGQNACGDLINRLMPAAGNIASLPQLLRWARERFPDQHGPEDWRAPPSIANAPFGSRSMRAVWAKFLSWAEGGQST
jgi:hypothetical protein